MMSDISAIPIEKVTGAVASGDGNHVLIRTDITPGNECLLAVKHDQIPNLIDVLAFGHMQCRKIQGTPPEQRDVHKTTWWELAFDPTVNLTVLSLTFGAGGRLDFALPGAMPSQLLETLRAHLEPSTFPKHKKPLN